MSERGQAQLFAVLVAGLAGTALAGILTAQERLLVDARGRRASEAAAQAAGAVVADAYVLRPSDETFVADPDVHDRALAAARQLAAANGGPVPREIVIRDAGRAVEVDLRAGRFRQRVAVTRSECCPR